MTQFGATASAKFSTSDMFLSFADVCDHTRNILLLAAILSFVSLTAISVLAKDRSRIINNGVREMPRLQQSDSVSRNKNATTL